MSDCNCKEEENVMRELEQLVIQQATEISILKNKNADQALLISNLSVDRVLDEEFHTMTRRNQ